MGRAAHLECLEACGLQAHLHGHVLAVLALLAHLPVGGDKHAHQQRREHVSTTTRQGINMARTIFAGCATSTQASVWCRYSTN